MLDMPGHRPSSPTRPAPRSPLGLPLTRNASTSAPPAPQRPNASTASVEANADTLTEQRSPLSPPTRPPPIRPASTSLSVLSPRSPQCGTSHVASLVSKFSAPNSPTAFFSFPSSPVASPSVATQPPLPAVNAQIDDVTPSESAADVKHVHKRVLHNPHVHTMPFSATPKQADTQPHADIAATLDTSSNTALPHSSTITEQTNASASPSSSASASLPYPVPVLCTTRSVTADWRIHDDTTLGSGFSSTVKLATSLHAPSLQAACKIIDKRTASVDLVKFADECRVLSGVCHASIVEIYGSYEDATHVYVLTELCAGGELFDVLCACGDKGMDEWEAAPLVAQLLDALAYLHGRGICHRDVKPENCLFLQPYPAPQPASSPTSATHHPSPLPCLKLTDFGFAANLLTKARGMRASSHLGSLGYTAPEIFASSSYTESCDVWSVGAILHIMMTGLPPYTRLGEDERKQPFWLYVNEMHWGERQGPVDVGGRGWEGRSDEVQALVRGMLELDVAKRLRASEALLSGWVKDGLARLRRSHAAAEQAAGDGPAAGWSSQSVRERSSSKASAQLTMREVMAEIVARAGQTRDGEGATGGCKAIEEEECKVSMEAEADAAGGISDSVLRPEKRTAAQRRLKALTMDWRH